MRNALWLGVVFTSLVFCVLLIYDRVPLGIAAEWEWGRLDELCDWLAIAIALLTGLLYGLCIGLGVWLIRRGGVGARALALALLTAGGLVLQVSLQQVSPFGLAKWVLVLYQPGSSGYYTAARTEVRSARQFLRDYPELQSRHGPFHLGTHPPGLVLAHYAALRWCESSKSLTNSILSLVPDSERSRLRVLLPGQRVPAADLASIWLVAALSQLLASLAAVPTYGLARRVAGAKAAYAAASLWPLVPAVGLFVPKSDVIYPLFAVAGAATALAGRSRVGRCLAGIVAGIVLGGGMCFTFGLVAMLPFLAVAIAIDERIVTRAGLAAAAQRLGAFVLGMAFVVAAVWLASRHNLLATWLACYRKHATFYAVMPRSYWGWAWFNLPEFAVASGIPLMLAAWAGSVRLLRGSTTTRYEEQHTGGNGCADLEATAPRDRRATDSTGGRPAGGIVWAWWFTVLALDLSGKNRGEIARLWMFLMPFAAVPAAYLLERLERRRWPVLLMLASQFAQCAVMQCSLQGFIDPHSLPRKATPRHGGVASPAEQRNDGAHLSVAPRQAECGAGTG
jgi:hypothetical protein